MFHVYCCVPMVQGVRAHKRMPFARLELLVLEAEKLYESILIRARNRFCNDFWNARTCRIDITAIMLCGKA